MESRFLKAYRKSQYVILYIIGFILIGVMSLIDKQSGINFGALKSWAWYVEQFVTAFAILSTVSATVLMVVDNFKETNAEYKELVTSIKDFADKEYVPTLFARFLNHVNPMRKKAQHEFNIKKALYNLDKHAHGRKGPTDEDLYTWATGSDEEKKKNSYCKRRKRLEERLTEKWIKENLDSIAVPYDKITSAVVLGGYYSRQDNDSPNEFVTKHTESKVLRDRGPLLVAGIALSSIVSSVIITLIFNGEAVVSILTKVFVLLFQIFYSIKYALDWCQNITLKDMRFRKSVAQEYKYWLKQQAANRPIPQPQPEIVLKPTVERYEPSIKEDIIFLGEIKENS